MEKNSQTFGNTTNTPIPAPISLLPDPTPTPLTFYILWFRYGSNPHTQPKYFEFSGSFQDAIARGKKHCEILNLRFIKVEQFVSNLSEEERKHNL